MNREHNRDFLLLDFKRGCIKKLWGKQQLGKVVDMETIVNLTPPAVEDLRTLSFKDHRSPFRPKTSGTFA